MTGKLFVNFYAAFSFAALLLVFTGCQEKDYYDPNYLPKSGIQASELDFSTTRSIQFNFNGLLSNGLITAFDVYAENPYTKNSSGVWEKRADLTPIAGGINVQGVTTVTRTLPTYVSELYAVPSTLFAPTLMYAQISNNTATFEEFNISSAVTEGAETRSLGNTTVDYYLSPILEMVGSHYRPSIELLQKEFPTAVKNAISATFINARKADDKYYADASIEIMEEDEKGEGAELWVSVIHSDGIYNNSLMYFCYNGRKELSELDAQERSSLKVISAFQYAKLGALKAGEYIKLKYWDGKELVDKFPVGTKVGWILSSNGFGYSQNNNYPNYNPQNDNTYIGATANSKTDKPWFYSVNKWNPETNNKNHTISFTAQYNSVDYICFGFEDMYNEQVDGIYPGDGDCNDVMFHVMANPVKALNPPPYIMEEGAIEYAETATGMLLFEDNWPWKGDYDINDVVVQYKSEITYYQKTLGGDPVDDVMVRRIADEMAIVNDGATFHNGYSYKVGFAPTLLKSLTVDGSDYSPYNDSDGFIVDLCADVKAINVGRRYAIAMEFNDDALSAEDFNSSGSGAYAKAPYNPFITPTNPMVNSDGIEVHLPFYPPTGRADMALFGTYYDGSNSAEGSYYAAPENVQYPFALHLPNVESITIPYEGMPISNTYPRYTSWVENGCGIVDADWYLYPNP